MEGRRAWAHTWCFRSFELGGMCRRGGSVGSMATPLLSSLSLTLLLSPSPTTIERRRGPLKMRSPSTQSTSWPPARGSGGVIGSFMLPMMGMVLIWVELAIVLLAFGGRAEDCVGF